jgi:hypothetical protein
LPESPFPTTDMIGTVFNASIIRCPPWLSRRC